MSTGKLARPSLALDSILAVSQGPYCAPKCDEDIEARLIAKARRAVVRSAQCIEGEEVISASLCRVDCPQTKEQAMKRFISMGLLISAAACGVVQVRTPTAATQSSAEPAAGSAGDQEREKQEEARRKERFVRSRRR